jgi:hypothetical protein
MKRVIISLFVVTMAFGTLVAPDSNAGQRRRVVVRHPRPRTTLVVRRGHPVVRRLPSTVVVRPARTRVVVGAPLVFLPALAWTAATVSLPPRDRLVWEDSEVIERDEEWVDANFGIDGKGDALYLQLQGTAQISFAEVTFANGNVQVVDFNDRVHSTGLYKLLDFNDGRHVKTTRLLAKSNSDETKLVVYLSK